MQRTDLIDSGDGKSVVASTLDGEPYILAQSRARILKERGMRRRRMSKLWRRLHELRGQSLRRDELVLKLGAAKKEAGRGLHRCSALGRGEGRYRAEACSP